MPFSLSGSNVKLHVKYTPENKDTNTMPRKSEHIRQNVNIDSTQAKRIQSVFGISAKTIQDAAKGDVEAARQLGKLAVEGANIRENEEVILNSIEAVVGGTLSSARISAAILTKGNSASKQIKSLQQNAVTSEKQYLNGVEEMNLSFRNANEYERLRHGQAVEHIGRTQRVKLNRMSADIEYQNAEIESGLFFSQKDADLQHKKALRAHGYKYGNDATPSLVSKKDYQIGGVTDSLTSAMGRIKNWLFGQS